MEGYYDWNEMKSSTFGYDTWLSSFEILASDGREYEEGKAVFFATLRKANPQYLKDVSFSRDKLWLRVEIEGNPSQMLPIEYHSDGVRTYMEMVAELAYRCIVLNGYKGENAVLDTHGIVMIDELDLHLHPSWQKHVVADLQAAFPNIQFIATTHSPFIVQSLAREELINLDDPEGTEASPEDMTLAEVATEIMGVEHPRSDNFIERYLAAKEKLETIQARNGELLMRDYDQVASDIMAEFLEGETDDPVYRAYLELQNRKNSDETN